VHFDNVISTNNNEGSGERISAVESIYNKGAVHRRSFYPKGDNNCTPLRSKRCRKGLGIEIKFDSILTFFCSKERHRYEPATYY
jgi:hypothetical protein